MPCGPVFPCGEERDANCWVCNEHGPDHYAEEWDALMHGKCALWWLFHTEEGKIVLNHRHESRIRIDSAIIEITFTVE